MEFLIGDSFLPFGLFCQFVLLNVLIMLCQAKSKQNEEAVPQNVKILTVHPPIATQQPPLPAPCATSAPPRTSNITTEALKKEVQKHSPKVHIRSETTVKMISLQSTQPDAAERRNKGEKLKINKTQSETELEDVPLVTSVIIDKTQASISQRVDDSADTGEYVDDLPEEREQSSSE
ncbi:unnamed protein product [Litomosoides sigmodontis]|uniref:Uncharacterized protein n=1 Tax=Litomosoides sigmodontis TaxID=42156 RepID=A0A3P6UVG9_LITSI|nr:unnamed protein product [Litomosoides sigmodontis]